MTNRPKGLLVSGRTAAAGFTLIEMLLVLAIAALGASMAAPSVTSGIKTAELKTACRKAGAIMRRARSRAAAYKLTMAADINVETKTISLRPFETVRENTEEDSKEKEEEKTDRSLPSYSLPRGVYIEKVGVGDKDKEEDAERSVIFFYPDGRSTGGEIVFKNDRGAALSLKVDRITGSAEIKEAPRED